MRNYQRRRGLDPSAGEPGILTAAMFLGKTGREPYVIPEQLFQFNDHAREDDVDEMAAFFDLIKEGLKMVVRRKAQTDVGGNPYKYPNFIRPKSPEGAKVVLIGNIDQFIKDYQAGKIRTDFTYDDLIAEAEQA